MALNETGIGDGWQEGKAQSSISTSASDITVAYTGPDGIERENIYPNAAPSDIVAMNTAADLSVPPTKTKTYQEKFIEKLENFKADPYCTEIEIDFKTLDLHWPPSVGHAKVKIKRGLPKIIKYFKKKEEREN